MRALAVVVALAAMATAATPAEAVNVRDHRAASQGPGLYPLQAPAVFELTLNRQFRQRTTCETRNLTGRADPVLHVLRRPTADGPVNEVARDDDSAGALNARVSFTASLPGRYLVIMRASGSGREGTADLYCDGRPVWTSLPVAGAFKRLQDLNPRETLRTVAGPGGSSAHALYLLDDNGGLLARYASGPSGSAFLSGGQSGLRVAMVAGQWPTPTGEIRLIRNDNLIAGRDPDGDGLGSGLERAIGTCSALSGLAESFECARAADPRDTDGDGLSDGLEVLGKLDAAPFQQLPEWGADPRHKDLFIEVDFGLATPAEPQQKMSPAQAAAFMNVFGDPETSPILRLLHAQQLVNPDLQPGVNVHLDIGVDPPAGAPRSTLVTYGDWGGHSVVQPVCAPNGTCQRAAAGAVYASMMDPARRGLFHYALGDPGGGGQAGPGIALNFPMGSGVTAAHEFGHTLGLNHEGKRPGVNCSPTYPSIMNYAYQSRQPAAFSDGEGRPAINDINLREMAAVTNPGSTAGAKHLRDLRDVFGFTVDTAIGAVDWNRDGVYATEPVQAYASFAPGASGGCEITRDSQISANGLSDVAPAIVRLNSRILLFYVDEADRTLRLDVSSTDLNCPKLNADCGRLSQQRVAGGWNRGILSVDAQTLRRDGGEQVLVVFRTTQGLFETTLNARLDFTAPRPIGTRLPAIGEISLTGRAGRAWLAFRAADGAAILKVRSDTGGWSEDEGFVDGLGNGLAIAPGAAPGVLALTDATGADRLLAALPLQPSGNMLLYEQRAADGRWTPFTVQPRPDRVFGRPALAARPVATGSPLPARVDILYVRFSGGVGNVVMQTTLTASAVGANAPLRFVTAQHDNVWLFGNGVDLLFEPGGDTNLKAAISTALIEEGRPSPHRIWLRPKADGVVDFQQRNYSDWDAMRVPLCSLLRQNGAVVTCPSS